MPLIRFPTVKGLVYTIDLSKIADRENPRTVEAPVTSFPQETIVIEWGDGESSIIPVADFAKQQEHTYAEGAGDVFTVVIRSATGHLPRLYFSDDIGNVATPKFAMTHAVVSIDHFAGALGNGQPYTQFALCANAINLEYVDTRIIGGDTVSDLLSVFRYCSNLEQSLESFCFSFCTFSGVNFGNTFAFCSKLTGTIQPGIFDNASNATTISAIFHGCSGLTGPIPEGLFDNLINVANVSYAFSGCSGLTSPYEFWNKSYAATIQASNNCYTGCTGMDSSQIPTSYGGTMTVS